MSALTFSLKKPLQFAINCAALTPDALAKRTFNQIAAICALGSASGVKRISAGNYGGKLGPHHLKLHTIMGNKQS